MLTSHLKKGNYKSFKLFFGTVRHPVVLRLKAGKRSHSGKMTVATVCLVRNEKKSLPGRSSLVFNEEISNSD